MGSGVWLSSLVVGVLASHAYAQSPPPPPADTTTSAPGSTAPVPQSTLAMPQPYVAAPPPAPKEPHAICFFGRPYECSSLILLEAGFRASRDVAVIDANVGFLVQ